MDLKKAKKFLAFIVAGYWVLAIVIYLIAGPQFHYKNVMSDAYSATATIGDLTDNVIVKQQLTMPAEEITGFEMLVSTYGRINTGTLHIVLCNGDGVAVFKQDVDIAKFEHGKYNLVTFDTPLKTEHGESLNLILTTTGCETGNAISLYYGNSIATGRADIVQNIPEDECYAMNDQVGAGKLCLKIQGVRQLMFYKVYWPIVLTVFTLAMIISICWWKQAEQGKNNPLVSVCTLYTRYSFLIQQLVARDFKTKYKRSALGMAWSFLNPLLTMSVQYLVFAMLFESDIPNYPVYLLSGIVFYNFFNEAVSMGMTSITGNAALIKKVYMPKCIYPVSRILSSLINFVFAIIPLFLVMFLTGTAFKPALLLLIFDILCMLGFVMGMGLLMTTAMTFFQDTQFLWGVLSMMWMYLTPVFYPESIISAEILPIYRVNPLYQYISFARTCLIEGISPEPMAYFGCIVSSLVVLGVGIWTFKRHQDKFVLYL